MHFAVNVNDATFGGGNGHVGGRVWALTAVEAAALWAAAPRTSSRLGAADVPSATLRVSQGSASPQASDQPSVATNSVSSPAVISSFSRPFSTVVPTVGDVVSYFHALGITAPHNSDSTVSDGTPVSPTPLAVSSFHGAATTITTTAVATTMASTLYPPRGVLLPVGLPCIPFPACAGSAGGGDGRDGQRDATPMASAPIAASAPILL